MAKVTIANPKSVSASDHSQRAAPPNKTNPRQPSGLTGVFDVRSFADIRSLHLLRYLVIVDLIGVQALYVILHLVA